MALPPNSFFVTTDIAHESSLLEAFVGEKLLRLYKIDIPIFASGVINNSADMGPATVPDEVVAILIMQQEMPPVIYTHKNDSGFFVTEGLSGRPQQSFVLLVNCGYSQGCTIEGKVQVRLFHPANTIARETFLRHKFYEALSVKL
ncbi:hypothetical protein HO133_001547 [Letharia lupina]|uniref:Uncharacterized protein n=1 Tax=Letharia lupina TaxID=560253 RepID=A0A8H6CFV2_9LECA|nr:uncharacterized protein HO133_001547 [Letharia lupina]KAF6222461.1 hypothetical protein HO133_001547 [Letharia lupina]